MKLSKYFTFFVIAIFVFGCYLYYSNIVLSNRVNDIAAILKNQYNVSDQSMIESTKRLLIEKESFSDQLNRQSDFFIFYVTTLFIILSLFGVTVFYKLLDKKIKDAENTIRKNYKRQEENYAIQSKEFIDSKIVLYESVAHLNRLTAVSHKNDAGMLLGYSIQAAEYLIKKMTLKVEDVDKDGIVLLLNESQVVANNLNTTAKQQVIDFFTKDRGRNKIDFDKSIKIINNYNEGCYSAYGYSIAAGLENIIKNNK